jgi:DNA-binding IclR family transcriptional regulator
MPDAKQTVLDALTKAGKAVRPGDVAMATGLEKDAVAKALAALKKEGRVSCPKNCFYEPAAK